VRSAVDVSVLLTVRNRVSGWLSPAVLRSVHCLEMSGNAHNAHPVIQGYITEKRDLICRVAMRGCYTHQ
jgi:hypothetical protein